MRALLVAAACTGCLKPLVSDDPGPSGDIVPAGTSVPSITTGEDAAQLVANEFVSGLVPLRSAFAAGAPTRAWDFGPAPSFAAPMWVLAQRTSGGSLQLLPHPPIVGAIPGDKPYSPYWSLFTLIVTDAYAGELITSAGAIEEAVRDGLVEAPIAQHLAVDRPLVSPDVLLDVGNGVTLHPTALAFYEHHTVPYFDFGSFAIADLATVAPAHRYVLAREGEPPLSEPIRGVDMNGDGDIDDTNDIYELAAADPQRVPLCATVNVVVVTTVASIDTSRSDDVADLESASQLTGGIVVAASATDDLRNCPQQRQDGGT
jgi:hypothetical protein